MAEASRSNSPCCLFCQNAVHFLKKMICLKGVNFMFEKKGFFAVVSAFSLLFSWMEGGESYVLLSVDGGGIRGIIPITMLTLLEEQLGKKPGELFDGFAGTSTGGIIAAALTVRDPANPKRPLHSAKEIQDLYLNQGREIFANSYFHKMKTLFGLLGPKYEVEGFTNLLKQELGKASLKGSIKDLCLTSFDLLSHHGYLFENFHPPASGDCPLIDAVLATSAAPTYFPSHAFQGHNLVDGGLLDNNPSSWAYFELLKAGKFANKEVYIVSIGTGYFPDASDSASSENLLDAAPRVIDDLFDAADETIDETMQALKVHYIRWQPLLYSEKQAAMDNTSEKNVQELKAIAEEYFAKGVKSEEFRPVLSILKLRAAAGR